MFICLPCLCVATDSTINSVTSIYVYAAFADLQCMLFRSSSKRPSTVKIRVKRCVACLITFVFCAEAQGQLLKSPSKDLYVRNV